MIHVVVSSRIDFEHAALNFNANYVHLFIIFLHFSVQTLDPVPLVANRDWTAALELVKR